MGSIKDAGNPAANVLKNPAQGIWKRWITNSAGVVLVAAMLGIGALSIAVSTYYYNNMQAGLEARARTASNFFNRYMNKSYNEYYLSAKRYIEEFSDRNKLELQFINTSGRIEISSSGLTAGTRANSDDVTRALETAAMSVWVGVDKSTGERIMSVSSPMLFSDNVVGVMRYVTSLKAVNRQILFGVALIICAGIIVIGLIAISNYYFIRSILGPMAQITEITKRIAGGSYGIQIEKKYNDEIGELCDTINDMSMKISYAERMKTEFISSVSHELRTPLTAIAGWGETLASGAISDESEIKKGIIIMLKEARRLTKLVEDLLDFTKMENGQFKLHMNAIDVRAEFEETVFVYSELLRKEDMRLEYNDAENIPQIRGDAERLKQVFLNILDNASKHGRDGRIIEADIKAADGFVIIKIRDYGVGIPDEELPHIKYRFYKGSSKTRGNGIGLAVCEEIVNMHNGRLIIENAEGGGVLVTIKLPTGEPIY